MIDGEDTVFFFKAYWRVGERMCYGVLALCSRGIY